MPILAGIPVDVDDGIPVVTAPPTQADLFADSRTLAFRSLDGVNLWPFTGKEFVAMQGITGLDFAPREVIDEPVPGLAGSRLREIRVLSREVFLPIFMAADAGHESYLDKRDSLCSILTHERVDYRATDGTFDLVANSVRGERFLRCVYVSGYEGTLAAASNGSWWESVGLTLRAVRPYWYGANWTTQQIAKSAEVSWFPDFPGQLTSSRVLGAGISLQVTGDIDSWPALDIMGPATSVTITGPGLSVVIPAGVAAGEMFTLITDPRGRAATFNGVGDWARVSPTDRYSPLAPGSALIDVVLTGATDATYARVYGESRYERAW